MCINHLSVYLSIYLYMILSSIEEYIFSVIYHVTIVSSVCILGVLTTTYNTYSNISNYIFVLTNVEIIHILNCDI